jgi:hypothetical protein
MMKEIENKDITVTCRAGIEGFILSYTTDSGVYYHRRYVGYGIMEAKNRFKEHVYREDSKMSRRMTREDVLAGALMSICGGSPAKARELLGNS